MGHDMRSPHVRRVRTYTTVGAVVALIGGLGCTQIAGAASSGTVALANSRPSFVAQARDLGAVPATRPVDFEVLLSLPDQSAVEAEVQALSTPGSPSFRKFLTPAQFRSTYSPSSAAVSAVESWVRAGGLTVKAVAPSRLYVEVTGTMGRAEALVGTALHDYAYQGLDLAEPVGSYHIPADLSAVVSGVVNLDDSSLLQKPTTDTGSTSPSATKNGPDGSLPGPPPGVTYGVQPCSSYYGQKMATTKPAAYGQHWPYTVCGYNADQYEKAFGLYQSIQNGTDGSGVTVAITDAYAAPTILSDADTWSTQNSLPRFAAGQFTQVTPKADAYTMETACDPQGWYGEETLDVESVHAMAPGSTIVFVGAKNCGGGLDKAWASTIDNHRGTWAPRACPPAWPTSTTSTSWKRTPPGSP
jgi:subtilase family serine protease